MRVLERLKSILMIVTVSVWLPATPVATAASIYDPVIVVQPTNKTVRVGDSLTVFTVSATGGEPFSYFWLKGTNVVEATPYWHYNIWGVQTNDAGDYSVIVRNSFGSVTSVVATLTVEPAGIPPFINWTLGMGAPPGSTVHLSVNATGTPPLSYQWYRDTTLPDETNTTLTIHNLQADDVGEYTVVVRNAFGSAAGKATADLFIPQPAVTNVIRIKPTITSPSRPVTHFAANQITFGGTLPDRMFFRGVYVQQNTNQFVPADPVNEPGTLSLFPDWSAAISLVPGTNILRVKAIDSAGNSTLTNSRTVIFDVTSHLTLTVEGSGRISGAKNGDPLIVGRKYVLRAKPDSGYLFSHWSGSVTSSASVLKFTMQSNAVLVANFVPNPFPAAAGQYYGSFSNTDSNLVEYRTSGGFRAIVRPSGRFTASLQIGRRKYGFAGQFDLEGRSTNMVYRAGLIAELQVDLSGGHQITGRVNGFDWSSHLTAYLVDFNKENPAIPFANAYTFLIPGAEEGSIAPASDGFGTLKIDAVGRATVFAALADGSKLALKSAISATGDLVFYALLGSGSLLGWVHLQPSEAPQLVGESWWFRIAEPRSGYYTNGFTLRSRIIGSLAPADVGP